MGEQPFGRSITEGYYTGRQSTPQEEHRQLVDVQFPAVQEKESCGEGCQGGHGYSLWKEVQRNDINKDDRKWNSTLHFVSENFLLYCHTSINTEKLRLASIFRKKIFKILK